MTSLLGSDVISKTFFGYFEENLSNSISAPNFIVIEQETTKLGGGHNAPPPPYRSVFKIAHTVK